ncbi:MAG: (d)CMP kinase [Clostridia bacterium]|nr:(d)CMP kinase [Clostridia bacterium]
MEHKVIGIEGLVGSGKTSICKELIKILPNTILFNAGNLYRGVVLALIKEHKDLKSLKNINILDLIKKTNIQIKIENNETMVYLNDIKLDDEQLQNDENSLAVSEVSNIANNKEAFLYVRKLISDLKEKYNIVFSGRALMEIYPELDYHFFITADLDERVRRKSIQYKNKIQLNVLKEHIETRDRLQENSGFYKIYPNTIKIDVTDCMTIKDSTNKVLLKIDQETFG